MNGDLYGDFSRLTFAPEKHFSAVLVQQGRVMLDADANEHTAVMLHHLRRLTADLIGSYGGPQGANGFRISLDSSTRPPILGIGAGRYYVHGLLCEVDEATTYFEQPDAFLSPGLGYDKLPTGPFVVYLMVRERQITAIEDPSIRDPALGKNGPDTATRTKIVWQVRASSDWPPRSGQDVGADLAAARQTWTDWESARVEGQTTLAGRKAAELRARTHQPLPTEPGPSAVSPGGSYRGLENQLYRVEIHDGGVANVATFKWSRDNGSVVFPLESVNGSEARVVSLDRDRRLGLDVGDWVEIVDDRSVLRGERHPLCRVASVQPLDLSVFFEEAPVGDVRWDPDQHPFLRRWDQKDGSAASGYAALTDDGVLEVTEGTWIELEQGVQIHFDTADEYIAGDYWLIPARTETRDVEWPQRAGEPATRPPTGIGYVYAPLAYVDGAGAVSDMRSEFPSLSKMIA
jgi:hypothetical protein